jgi:hypothetical protein
VVPPTANTTRATPALSLAEAVSATLPRTTAPDPTPPSVTDGATSSRKFATTDRSSLNATEQVRPEQSPLQPSNTKPDTAGVAFKAVPVGTSSHSSLPSTSTHSRLSTKA